MSQKDPSKRPKQTPLRAVANIEYIWKKCFFAFLGTKKGVVTGIFLASVWEGSCNEKTQRIHFLVVFSVPAYVGTDQNAA